MIAPEKLLSTTHWARDLPADELERACKGLAERNIAQGAYLCHRGDRLDSWTGVLSGLLKLGSTSRSGKSVTFAGLPEGMWFGEGSLIKGEPRRYEVVALRDTRVAMMNRQTFNWLFDNSVAFNRFLVRQFNERLGQFIALVEHDRMLDAPGRLARNIAWLFNPVLNPLAGDNIEISQEEIGLLAGVSRQAANRGLRQLEEEGLIALEPGLVRLLDLDGLRLYGE